MLPPPTHASVDFTVVGAQKSATTSLFYLLKEHPKIYLPSEKELNFFSDDRKFSKGPEWYLREYFRNAPGETIVGDVSPEYLILPKAARRIRDTFPDIRVLCLVRNPIDRAHSHYRMAVKKGYETRAFDEVVQDADTRTYPTDPVTAQGTAYFAFSQYGYLLSHYFDLFPVERIRVVFTEDLARDPESVVRDTYTFLGVDSRFVPSCLNAKFNPSGELRVPRILDNAARALVYRFPMPDRLRRRILLWIELANLRPTAAGELPRSCREALRDVFASDVEILEKLIGRPVPWGEFRT